MKIKGFGPNYYVVSGINQDCNRYINFIFGNSSTLVILDMQGKVLQEYNNMCDGGRQSRYSDCPDYKRIREFIVRNQIDTDDKTHYLGVNPDDHTVSLMAEEALQVV